MDEKLALNFSPLKTQNFQFVIYRKLKEIGEKKNSFSFEVSDRALPKNKGSNDAEFPRYWISLSPQEEFTKFEVESLTNPYLTTEYLFSNLKNRCNKVLNSKDFYLDDSTFSNKVKFVINTLNEGNQIVWVEPFYLKETKNLGFLIDFKFDKKKEQPFNKKVQRLSLSLNSENRWNKSIYADKYSFVRDFAKLYYKKVFKNTNLDFETNELLPVSYLKKKCYLLSDNKEVFSQYKLKDFGVYKQIEDPIDIYFYYKPGEGAIVKNFYQQLENLLTKTYKLKVNFESFRVEQINKTNINKLIRKINNSQINKSLVIFLSENKYKNSDEYYLCKYEFTKNNIPTQFLTYPTVRNKYSVNNLALQIFSKLGGTPWRVKPRNQDCLIIGLGQANKREKRGNKFITSRYFAYSVLLDSSGVYKSLRIVSEADNKNSYLKNLGSSLVDIFNEYGDKYEKIVIHTPFKVKRDELKQIKDSITKVISKEFDFVVIRINTKNKFFAYNKNLNSLTPYESSLLKISSNEYLVWFEGLQFQDEIPQKRYSGPTYIDFLFWSKKEWTNKERKKFLKMKRPEETEIERYYLSESEKKDYLQDIINLSGANWRGFNAKSLPVSIYYCRIVANFVKEFRQRNYSRFDFSNLQPWFL